MKTIVHEIEPALTARRDLLVVAAGAVLFWALSIAIELNERVLSITRPLERYQIDELPGVLLFLALAFAWYSWRRVREVQVQLQRRMSAEARLAETLTENRRLSLSHVQVQEAERKQLARELHDELGQHLNAIKIDAVSIRNWSAGRLHDVHEAACGIIKVADHVSDIIRSMLQRLRPVGLDELGLSAALEHLLQNWRVRNPAITTELTISASVDGLHEAQNMAVYRIVQEALNNVSRHAHAARVCIRLVRSADAIALSVADDGAGPDNRQPVRGLGLVGMRERVEALGGELQIMSAAGKGFSVRATFPARAKA